MSTSRLLELETTSVPDWELEDQLNATLSTELFAADPQESLEYLSQLRLELPDILDHRDLSRGAPDGTPLEASKVPNPARYDYHLVGVPLSILVPEDTAGHLRLVRLRLSVNIESSSEEPAVAWDLFPTDTWTDTTVNLGQVGVDIGKLLTFVPTPAAQALSLNLELPLKWTSTHVRVSTSDRMSNPVEWYVTDRSINNGLTTYLIAQVTKGASLALRVSVVGELRRSGLLGKMTRARFRAAEQRYPLVKN